MRQWGAGDICASDGVFTFEQANAARASEYFSICALRAAVSIIQDIDTAQRAELVWEIDDDDYAATPGAVWEVARPLVHRDDVWCINKNGAEVHREEHTSKDEMKARTTQLQAVLNAAPPEVPVDYTAKNTPDHATVS
jgi:hypothetical protein